MFLFLLKINFNHEIISIQIQNQVRGRICIIQVLVLSIFLKLLVDNEDEGNVLRDQNAPPSYEETINVQEVKIEDIEEQRVAFHQHIEEPPPYTEY